MGRSDCLETSAESPNSAGKSRIRGPAPHGPTYVSVHVKRIVLT